MNYKQNYDEYISYVKTLKRTKNGMDYSELHHIIPRALGGSNNESNLVRLTAREHFLAHYLLAKIYEGTESEYKLSYAFIAMKRSRRYSSGKTQKRYINSRLYESYKKTYSKLASENMEGNVPWNKGKKNIYSEETLKKIGKASRKKKGTYHLNTKAKAKISKANTGLKRSIETKEKIRKSIEGRRFVCNDVTKEVKQVHKTQIDAYLSKGFRLGLKCI